MATEAEVSIINIYGVPETITPILTPTPTYVLYGLHYDSADNCWKAQIDTGFSESSITYTISATGYNSETISIPKEAATSFEVTLTPTKTKPEHLYAYTNASGKTLYAWTALDTDTINPATYKTIYTSTPTIETGMQTTMNNAYVLVDGALVNVSFSDIVSINGIGGELYVTESNNEYIEMKLSGPV